MHTCHSTHVEVERQLSEVGSPPLWVPGMELRSSDRKSFCPLSHLISPFMLFFAVVLKNTLVPILNPLPQPCELPAAPVLSIPIVLTQSLSRLTIAEVFHLLRFTWYESKPHCPMVWTLPPFLWITSRKSVVNLQVRGLAQGQGSSRKELRG